MVRGMCRDCSGCLLCQEPNPYDLDHRDYDEEWEIKADEGWEDKSWQDD